MMSGYWMDGHGRTGTGLDSSGSGGSGPCHRGPANCPGSSLRLGSGPGGPPSITPAGTVSSVDSTMDVTPSVLVRLMRLALGRNSASKVALPALTLVEMVAVPAAVKLRRTRLRLRRSMRLSPR